MSTSASTDYRFDEELSRCTVRVKTAKGSGTGFFVAPGKIMTCAHVVSPTVIDGSGIQVEWQGGSYKAEVVKVVPDPVPPTDIYPDLALLQVGIDGHPRVALDEDFAIDDPMYTYGYSDYNPNGVGATAEIEGMANYGDCGDQRLMRFKNGQFRSGMSGSPIFNMKAERVCGMLKSTRDQNSDLGGEGVTVKTIYWHFDFLRGQGPAGLVLVGPWREKEIQKMYQRIEAMDGDGWLDDLVYVALPINSKSAARHYAVIVEQCRKLNFTALQLYEYPNYKSHPIDTIRRLIWRSNLAVFNLTDEHPDVVYQLGYQDGLGVDDEAVLVVQHQPPSAKLNFSWFPVIPFGNDERLAEIIRERLRALSSTRDNSRRRRRA